MKASVHGWLPGDPLVVSRRPLGSIQVDSEFGPHLRRPRINGCPGNPHGGVPDLAGTVDSRRNLKSRVPKPPVFRMRFRTVNVEIDPLDRKSTRLNSSHL